MTLIVDHLSVKGKYELLKDVSLTLQPGEKLGIVGESGSGKTLLVRTLVKLLPPNITITSGTVTFNNQLLSSMSEHELQKVRGKEIGMVFQDPLTFLNPTKRIGEQINEAYRRHFPHCRENRALQLLHEVGIPDPEVRMRYYPHQLSGGQRQRVLIAIALAAHPTLLIADEPTTALDSTVQAQIMQLLKKLQAGRTTILISHDLSLIASFCDRVVVMYAGQIVEEAPTEELFRAPKHPYTQQLLKAIPSLHTHDKLATIPGSPPDPSKPTLGCPFAPRCPFVMDQCRTTPPPRTNNSLCWRTPTC